MDGWLKPNQEKRIIENCVESIMDDLDVYHFDEKLFQQYEKQLTEFFTKISEEHSLFSPRFDLLNKKNIVNDKKKIKKALKAIDELEISFDMISHDDDRDHMQVGYDIQTIKGILEK